MYPFHADPQSVLSGTQQEFLSTLIFAARDLALAQIYVSFPSLQIKCTACGYLQNEDEYLEHSCNCKVGRVLHLLKDLTEIPPPAETVFSPSQNERSTEQAAQPGRAGAAEAQPGAQHCVHCAQCDRIRDEWARSLNYWKEMMRAWEERYGFSIPSAAASPFQDANSNWSDALADGERAAGYRL